MRDRGDALEEVIRGLHDTNGFQDHGGDPAGTLGKDALERIEVVVDEGPGQFADRRRHSTATRGTPDIPVLPAVVAAAGNHVAPGIRACGAHGARRDVGAVLAKTNHLRARHDLRQHLGHFHFQRVGEGERDAVRELAPHRGEDVRVVVSEDDRPERHRVVDVLVAVHVPHVAPSPALEEDRRDALHELRRALAEGLRARRDDLTSPREVFP